MPVLVLHLARAALLLLIAGLLLGRRDFAHLNLGDLWTLCSLKPPSILANAFITESTLLALFPIAFWTARDRFQRAAGTTSREKFARAFGWSFCLPLAFVTWGAIHALIAKLSGGDTYLIVRQSALSFYPLFFVYAFLFFGCTEREMRLAAWSGVAVALLCALFDAFHWLDPSSIPPPAEWMPIYGQETLPIAILALGLCVVAAPTWKLRTLSFAGLAFAGWRQAARPMQSVVPIGMAGALALIICMGTILDLRGQRATLKRAVLCLALFAALGFGYLLRMQFKKAERPGTETSAEIKAWGLSQYADLFAIFERAEMPADPSKRMIANRPPYVPIEDPEVHKLQAVFDATGTNVSQRNNIWRFLVWRKMLLDWSSGRPIVGAGVGKPWLYKALYQTKFHYGDDREGLDPHNSYLDTLYRYGIVGFGLLLAAIAMTLALAFKALRANGGDLLLEGLLLYFGYTLVFAFFTVSLEGPAYSMPFWVTFGLIYGRAKQLGALNFQPPSN